MKITIISLDNWGFNHYIKNTLVENGHVVNHIDFNTFVYKYPNFFLKIYNFFLKKIVKKNLKAISYGKKINELLEKHNQIQDVIVTIKGDFIDPLEIQKFKKYTSRSIAFFNDSVNRCPKIKRVLPYFDEVFSFEKADCAKFNLKFAPNWIYNYTPKNESEILNKKYDHQVFNITTKDQRLPIVYAIAKALKQKKIDCKILIFDKKKQPKNPYLEYISKHISLEEVNEYITNSQVLLDVNRKGQEGLTFRVFESLGLQKKIITTNKDIQNYDFYNPNNILIIDENNPEIPVAFFEKDYEKIPEAIFHKYTTVGWVKNVIFNEHNNYFR